MPYLLAWGEAFSDRFAIDFLLVLENHSDVGCAFWQCVTTTEICFVINKIQHVYVTCVCHTDLLSSFGQLTCRQSWKPTVMSSVVNLLWAAWKNGSTKTCTSTLQAWLFAETYSTASVIHHTLRPINSHFLYEAGLSGYLVLCAPWVHTIVAVWMNEWIYLMENPQDKKGHKTTYTCPHTAEHIYR